jgi:hypothetical protein
MPSGRDSFRRNRVAPLVVTIVASAGAMRRIAAEGELGSISLHPSAMAIDSAFQRSR